MQLARERLLHFFCAFKNFMLKIVKSLAIKKNVTNLAVL
jgi:hypothetical protein